MAHEYTGRKFSIPFFVIINTLLFVVVLGLLFFCAPNLWRTQLEAPWWSFVVTFLLAHLGIAFVEFFLHRYVLHAPLIRFLKYFYQQHTRHHAHTRIRMKYSLHNGPPDTGTVENIYPILEDFQHEASFFPWYTFFVLATVLTFFFVPLQVLLPNTPVFLAGFSALMWSILLYEIFHALEHKPLKQWLPYLEHPTRGNFWKMVYGFHMRHHVNVSCNESVSGFFGLPIPDWVFRTYIKAESLYTHGSIAVPIQFVPPVPRFIGWLDTLTVYVVKRRFAAQTKRAEKRHLKVLADQAKNRRKGIVDV